MGAGEVDDMDAMRRGDRTGGMEGEGDAGAEDGAGDARADSNESNIEEVGVW